MRRLDLRPRKKLRNPERHLRQLARWPDWIGGQLLDRPMEADERFRNCKVPVYSKLVDPPHATPETQRACIAAIFAAAAAVEHSPRRPRNCRVACLITTPFLFQSEVTLFFDEAYFRTFLPAMTPEVKRTSWDGGWVEAGPADVAGMSNIMPPAPEGLAFGGGLWLREFEEGRGAPIESATWVWAFPFSSGASGAR